MSHFDMHSLSRNVDPLFHPWNKRKSHVPPGKVQPKRLQTATFLGPRPSPSIPNCSQGDNLTSYFLSCICTVQHFSSFFSACSMVSLEREQALHEGSSFDCTCLLPKLTSHIDAAKRSSWCSWVSTQCPYFWYKSNVARGAQRKGRTYTETSCSVKLAVSNCRLQNWHRKSFLA